MFTTTWFIKEPGTPHVAAWHQDATHFGLEPNDQHVTAWLALSDASLESGCMQFSAGSHKRGQLAHGYGVAASVNDANQFIPNPGQLGTIADCSSSPANFRCTTPCWCTNRGRTTAWTGASASAFPTFRPGSSTPGLSDTPRIWYAALTATATSTSIRRPRAISMRRRKPRTMPRTRAMPRTMRNRSSDT